MNACPTRTFSNRGQQIAMAGFGGVIVLLGLAGLTQRAWVEGAAYVVLGALTIMRALRSSNVTLDDENVITRSMVRTRRFPLDELDSVDVAVGRTGLNGFGREYLVLSGRNAEPFAFKELNAKPSDGHTVVRQAAEAIGSALLRARTVHGRRSTATSGNSSKSP